METKIARENFTNWNNALQSKGLAKVVSFYSEDATFLPTMSDEFKKGKIGAEEYFKHFLEKNPIGKIIADQVQDLGQNRYLHSGFYNFEIDSDRENREIVEARFSFVWKKNKEGEWKILHHHSSVKPKGEQMA